MAKKLNKRYKIKYPQFFGLKERKNGKDYNFRETMFGYICILDRENWITMPKPIIEKNSEIYEKKDTGDSFEKWAPEFDAAKKQFAAMKKIQRINKKRLAESKKDS